LAVTIDWQTFDARQVLRNEKAQSEELRSADNFGECMGATFYFDKMLPTVSPEVPGPNPTRQLELFTLGGKKFIRIGPPNEEHSGVGRYTVELRQEDGLELARQLNDLFK
jgi:hypothetical protein